MYLPISMLNKDILRKGVEKGHLKTIQLPVSLIVEETDPEEINDLGNVLTLIFVSAKI